MFYMFSIQNLCDSKAIRRLVNTDLFYKFLANLCLIKPFLLYMNNTIKCNDIIIIIIILF